jgi:uncharacterized repeat protein (TIGR01451 family)
MRSLYIFLFLICLPNVFSLSVYINETQNNIIENTRVQIQVNGTISITNISSEIFEVDIKRNNIFEVNLELNQTNLTDFTYLIEAVIPLSFYNNFVNLGESFLEHTTNFDIQTHRDVSLIKFDRDDNITFSSRDIKIKANNPTNYTQKILINLIKTRPNQVNEFRNQLYLLTLYELVLNPFEKEELTYKDVLSEIGDSYFIDFSMEIIPNSIRNINRSEVFISKSTSGSSNSDSFNLLTKDLVITKTITPEVFQNGDILEVKFLITNPNSFSLNNIKIKDIIPEGFIFLENKELDIYYINENFLPFETKEINYKLIYVGENQNFILIPETQVTYQDTTYYSNPLRLYPKIDDVAPQLLIEKILSPLDNFRTLVQIYIKNIGNITIEGFTLEDQNRSFYIPNLDIGEEYLIQYESEEVDYSLPKITSESNVTSSIIVNDKVSITHNTKSKVPLYSTLLIILAGVLLISDIVL